jgi:hypothetical protein
MVSRCCTFAIGALAILTVECQGGFEPKDSGTDAADPCDEVGCSGHGRCVDDDGVALCVCDTGYSVSGVECLPTAPDGDADLDAAPDADRDTPADADEVECADSDGDGVCDGDDRCPGIDDALGGQVIDPDFDDETAWAWAGNASVIDGAGAFVIDECSDSHVGSLRQEACLPPPRDGWPVVQAAVRWRCEQCALHWGRAGFVVSVGADRYTFDTNDLFGFYPLSGETVLAMCPGERAFGAIEQVGIDAEISFLSLGMSCEHQLAFDRLWLEEAAPGQCPRPGEVINGSFDPDAGGWTPSALLTVDTDGTTFASLYASALIPVGSVQVRGSLGVPLETTMPSPSLHVRMRGNLGGAGFFSVTLVLDGASTTLWQTSTLVGIWTVVPLCLPPESLGSSGRIELALFSIDPERTVDLSADIDAVEILSDPTTCP